MTSRIPAALLIAASLAACAGTMAGGAPRNAPAQAHARPKLIVQLVVDQFRADYVPRYRAQWTRGLHRLLNDGAHFTEARYPYSGTITCAGHASIGTGTVPSVHGMVLNEWWDREMRLRIHCPNDPLVTPIGFTKPATTRYSGRRMLTQTFADRLDASQPPDAGRVVTMALKPRSAIGLAGHGGDAVVWFEGGTFATSSAFGQPAWLGEWLKAHPVEASTGREWTRARAAAEYIGSDDDAAAKPPQGWTARFPHKLSDSGTADALFYDRWQRSPFSDAYLADMAIAAVDAMALGRGPGIDYLGVSFSGLDLVGHKFGPGSHEVQDMLIGVDEQIGRLLAHLDAAVGAGNYVVALSSDHGVGEIPELLGGKGGRLVRGTTARLIEDVLDKAWGADAKHVEYDLYTDFYLTEATRARLASDESAVAALRKAIEADPAVLRMMTARDFERARASSDPMLAAALLSYYPGRSGDISLLLRENYTSSTDATSHAQKRADAEQLVLNKIYASSVPYFLFKEAFQEPMTSVVTSIYGTKRVYNKEKKGQHLGIDYRAAIGDKVPVANAGKVVFAGDLFYTGWTVIVDHGMDIFSVYGHCSKTLVKEGDMVERGQVIALSGNTGRTSGPHLHWGVKIQGQYVDGFVLIEETKKAFKE